MEWWDYDFLALEIFWRSISGCQRRLWRRWSWPSYHVNTMRLSEIQFSYVWYNSYLHILSMLSLSHVCRIGNVMNRIPRLQEASAPGPGCQCGMKPCCKGNTVILEMCRGLWTWKGVEGGNFMAVVLCHWHAKCSSWTGATRSSSVGAALRIFMISSCGLVSVASRDLVFALGDHALKCFYEQNVAFLTDNFGENMTVVGVVSVVTEIAPCQPAKGCPRRAKIVKWIL